MLFRFFIRPHSSPFVIRHKKPTGHWLFIQLAAPNWMDNQWSVSCMRRMTNGDEWKSETTPLLQSQAFSLLQVVNTKILCNGRQPRHRELFAKRTTNRRKRQNAENREQSEALKEEVTTPTQDPRDYEACKRDVFRWTQYPTLNGTYIATISKE